MKTVKFLFAFLVISACLINIQAATNINNAPFFQEKFTKDRVWDAQRSPAYPIAGRNWTISGLKAALEANGSAINWGTGRYLRFVAEADIFKSANSLLDDISNSYKYNVVLKLYENNGTLVKIVSRWGRIIGIGDKGFMYEAEGRYGSFFSMSDQTASAVTTYKPSLANATKLSEIAKLTTNTIVVKQDPVTTQTTLETAPVQKCNFKVIYNNTDMLFQEVSGLDSEAQQIEYKQGNSPALSVVKMPGITKMGNVILKKGIFKTIGQKSDCYELLSKSNTSKSTIVICLMDENGSVSMKWSLKNAWINKMTGIGNSPDDLTVESIEIAHEGITMESK